MSADVRIIVELCAGMATKASFDKLSPRRLKCDLSSALGDIDVSSVVRRADGDARSDLDVLTACGQLSTCYNLIRYVQGKLDDTGAGDPADTALRQLRDLAVADWNRLQASPFMFVDERLERGRSAAHTRYLAEIAGRKDRPE